MTLSARKELPSNLDGRMKFNNEENILPGTVAAVFLQV